MKLTSLELLACRSARDFTAVHWLVVPTRWRANDCHCCGPDVLAKVTQTSVTADDASPLIVALNETFSLSRSNVADRCPSDGGSAALVVPVGR